MPFQSRDLSVLAYANGFTLWHYRTGDRVADLVETEAAPGYFAPACELLRSGDQIIVSLEHDGRPGLVNLLVGAVDPAGAVAVAPV